MLITGDLGPPTPRAPAGSCWLDAPHRGKDLLSQRHFMALKCSVGSLFCTRRAERAQLVWSWVWTVSAPSDGNYSNMLPSNDLPRDSIGLYKFLMIQIHFLIALIQVYYFSLWNNSCCMFPVIKTLLHFFCFIFSSIPVLTKITSFTTATATVLSVSARCSGLGTRRGHSGLVKISIRAGLAPWVPCGAAPPLHQGERRIRIRLFAFVTSLPKNSCSGVCLCDTGSEYFHSSPLPGIHFL